MSADDPRVGSLAPSAAISSAYDRAGKSLQEVEADIAATRADLAQSLDELKRQLAPERLVERSVGVLQDIMSSRGLRETLRGHPVPLALIGMGIGWMLASRSTRTRIGDGGATAGGCLSSTLPSAADAAPSSRVHVADERGTIGEDAAAMNSAPRTEARGTVWRVQRGRRSAWHRASDYVGHANAQLCGSRDRLLRFVGDHPMLTGTFGFLAGCWVGLMARPTAIEERLMGPTADELRQQAVSLRRAATERVRDAAEQTIDAVVDAVEQAIGEVGDGKGGAR